MARTSRQHFDPYVLPPSNQADARDRYWAGMAQLFAEAEGTLPRIVRNVGAAPQRTAPKRPPEWRIPDIERAKTIRREGDAMPGHNDEGDAFRHAETARRLSEALGPVVTDWLGQLQEYRQAIEGQPWDETMMDIDSNGEGVRAYREGRPVDRNRLQSRPGANRGRAGR